MERAGMHPHLPARQHRAPESFLPQQDGFICADCRPLSSVLPHSHHPVLAGLQHDEGWG